MTEHSPVPIDVREIMWKFSNNVNFVAKSGKQSTPPAYWNVPTFTRTQSDDSPEEYNNKTRYDLFCSHRVYCCIRYMKQQQHLINLNKNTNNKNAIYDEYRTSTCFGKIVPTAENILEQNN